MRLLIRARCAMRSTRAPAKPRSENSRRAAARILSRLRAESRLRGVVGRLRAMTDTPRRRETINPRTVTDWLLLGQEAQGVKGIIGDAEIPGTILVRSARRVIGSGAAPVPSY